MHRACTSNLNLARRPPQLSLLKKEKSAYGGELLKSRAGRRHGRPLSTRETMHLVLRSSKAKGEWSFRKRQNERQVSRIIDKFAVIYAVRVISMANVGNHLHLQIKLSNRFTYTPFIRAVTAAIAMAITGRNRWTKAKLRETNATNATEATTKTKLTEYGSSGSKLRATSRAKSEKFWDYRPFTRVVEGFTAWLTLKDYIKINNFEGSGYTRANARFMLRVERRLASEVDFDSRL